MPNVVPGVTPGIASVPRLEAWLDAKITQVQLIAGGRSNLTYRLTLDGPGPRGPGARDPGTRDLVLRRPPLGHVLPTAHDMSREFRVITGLRSHTDVPVATPIAYCADPEVVGAPFYLMEYVAGDIVRTAEQAAQALTEVQAAGLSRELATMLARIHAVDVHQAGLDKLGRGKGFLRRQLDRWQRQWDLSKTRELPGYDDLVRRLTENLPDDSNEETTLVHGDFRLDNAIVRTRTGTGTGTGTDAKHIAAVVDWEMATLGDPLADLGLTLVYWTERGEQSYGADATTAPGFLTRNEFAEAYATAAQRDVSNVSYYMAFGYFKLAVVLEGINARFLQHQTVGDDFDREGRAVPQLIAQAHAHLA